MRLGRVPSGRTLFPLDQQPDEREQVALGGLPLHIGERAPITVLQGGTSDTLATALSITLGARHHRSRTA